jgi:hypothetical protein
MRGVDVIEARVRKIKAFATHVLSPSSSFNAAEINQRLGDTVFLTKRNEMNKN